MIEHNEMMMNLSEDEMLALWKKVLCLDPVRRDCSMEREDGVDLDGLLKLHIRQWYDQLLHSAPVEMLPVEDFAACDMKLHVNKMGMVTANLPDRCLQPVEWKLTAWEKSVSLFYAPTSPVAVYSICEWTQASVADPVAINYGNRLLLVSVPPESYPVVEIARCVAKPADGRYVFHPAALNTIPGWSAHNVIFA